MRVGVIARATDRGLGIQTWEAARHLDASVLVVDVENRSAIRHPTQRDRYPDARIVECRPGWRLDEHPVRTWLTQVDVVYTAETFYDERFCDWARSMGVATVVHANPEFTPPSGHGWGIGTPTAWWSATSWRLEHMPPGTTVVPMPVATDRFTITEPIEGPARWLHVAGKKTTGDRNGTEIVLAALRHLRRPCALRIVTQEPHLEVPEHPAHVNVDVVTGGVADYWQLYEDVDALILPRRYGGLCLPVQEAMAAGLAVAMLDTAPNTTWPVHRIALRGQTLVHTPAGQIAAADAHPADVAKAMDELADPQVRWPLQRLARAWANDNSWEARLDDWVTRLAELQAVAVA